MDIDVEKGPWNVIHEEEEGSHYFYVNTPHESTMAKCYNPDTANFIASAPDMYEALEELMDIVQGVIDDGDKLDSFTLQTARKALAKARGEKDDW